MKIIMEHVKRVRRLNNKGAALILSYLVLSVLFTLTAGFAVSTVSELNYAQNYRDSTSAFWLAESGLNRFAQDTTLLDGGDQTYYYGSNYVHLTKDDTSPSKRIVTATGNVRGVARSLQVEFAANPPTIFSYTMASGGNINLTAFFAGIDVSEKTRLSGSYSQYGLALGMFEDKVEGVDSDTVTLEYPDADNNGTPDEFTDFVQYNQNILSEYSSDEIVYVQRQEGDGPLEVWPYSSVNGQSLMNKKVLYVEGPTAGSGDVDLYFGPNWHDDQNLTVISTGSVNYYQPLQNPTNNSQLNTISWDNYTEGAILLSSHQGVTYSHSEANFGSLLSISYTDGSLLANDEINFVLGGVWKMFDYTSPVDENGFVPPGFEGLITSSSGGFSSTPGQWNEI